jgi:disulfide bond formation protein DsbB
VSSSAFTAPIGANYVNLVAVPEPTITVAALASLGLAGLMLWSMGLGVYHAGVEWGWFAGPTA